MRNRFVILCVFATLLPAVARGEAISLGVSAGNGGTSSPISGISSTSFAWGNTLGTASIPDSYGFGSFITPGTFSIGSEVFSILGEHGSVLMSSPFSVNAGDMVSVGFSVFTADTSPWGDIGFAALMKDGVVEALLGAVRPDGLNHFGDLPHPPSIDYPLPSAGVTSAYSTRPDPLAFTLDGIDYGQPGMFACAGNCITDVTSSVTPLAGTYQLLFAMFDTGCCSNTGALAVTSANVQRVPEPTTLQLLTSGTFVCISLIGLRARRRRV